MTTDAGQATADLVSSSIAAAAAQGTQSEPAPDVADTADAPDQLANDASRACLHCGAADNTKRCGGCRVAWFCDNDKQCLKAAWKTGHKQECKAEQAAAEKPAFGLVPSDKQENAQSSKPKALPAGMKTVPSWAQGAPAGDFDPHALQMSDSFDAQPLDEEDECTICRGAPMSRSGQGCCALECTHRYHRDWWANRNRTPRAQSLPSQPDC